MNNDYIVSILGSHCIDGDTSNVELTTVGSYAHKGSIRYITYKEYDEDHPEIELRSVLKVEKNKVTLIRNNINKSRLILEKGKRHQCLYSFNGACMMIGVFTQNMELNLDDHGGKIELWYSLDINTDLTCSNHIIIEVKKGD